MGERQSGGATPGRRRAHPDRMTARHPSAPQAVLDDAAVEALLSAAVLRGHRPDAAGEQRALAAYRAARAEGAHRARTRRRDDWRPRERRRLAMSARTTLSLLLASLTLGGVAVAAINSSGPTEAPGERRTSPSESASRRSAAPSAQSPAAPRTSRPDHPGTARDTEAKCRAYGKAEGSGKALESTAWQRLVAAAGGEDEVAAYCAEHLATAPARPGGGRGTGAPGDGTAGNGAAGNGADGNGADGAGTAGAPATGKGQGAGSGGSGGNDGNARNSGKNKD
ncbi:hypothetical protein ACFXDP_03365 [Streptomyces sp. NPDC059374]|uniref:hypothetical protein n=1 Tax=Streptomyces sp. NPDC059374 TaxID=3346814 RepID=UPI0036CE0B47